MITLILSALLIALGCCNGPNKTYSAVLNEKELTNASVLLLTAFITILVIVFSVAAFTASSSISPLSAPALPSEETASLVASAVPEQASSSAVPEEYVSVAPEDPSHIDPKFEVITDQFIAEQFACVKRRRYVDEVIQLPEMRTLQYIINLYIQLDYKNGSYSSQEVYHKQLNEFKTYFGQVMQSTFVNRIIAGGFWTRINIAQVASELKMLFDSIGPGLGGPRPKTWLQYATSRCKQIEKNYIMRRQMLSQVNSFRDTPPKDLLDMSQLRELQMLICTKATSELNEASYNRVLEVNPWLLGDTYDSIVWVISHSLRTWLLWAFGSAYSKIHRQSQTIQEYQAKSKQFLSNLINLLNDIQVDSTQDNLPWSVLAVKRLSGC